MHAIIKSAGVESRAATLAVNLAKDVFERAFADAGGRMIERKRLRRGLFKICLNNPS